MTESRLKVVDPANPAAPLTSDDFRQVWHTSDVRPHERLAYFKNAISQTLPSCTLKLGPNGQIAGRVDKASLNHGVAARLKISGGSLKRTSTDLTNIHDDYINLTLTTAGKSQTRCERGLVLLNVGDVVMTDSAHCFDSDNQSDEFYSCLSLIFSKKHISALIGSDCDAHNLRVKKQPLAPALVGCLAIMDGRYAGGSWHELSALYDACLAMSAALLSRDRDVLENASPANASVSYGLLAAIKGFVDHNLPDPMLSPAHVASRFGISVRYVHKLFQGESETFSTYVLNARLSRVRADLLTISKTNMPLSELVHRWGFRDMTTFYRTFKRRYDLTPGRMRSASGVLARLD